MASMMELVQHYYARERQFALLAAGVGGAMLSVAVIVWNRALRASLGKGMAYPLMAAGMLLAIMSASYALTVDRRLEAATVTYSGRPDAVVRRHELRRMQGVVESGYTVALAVDTALIVLGLILAFSIGNVPFWKGVALSLMIAGVTGHVIEAFSMQANRQYLQAVEFP